MYLLYNGGSADAGARVQHADRRASTSTRCSASSCRIPGRRQPPDAQPRRSATTTTSARCRHSRRPAVCSSRRRRIPRIEPDQAEHRGVAHRRSCTTDRRRPDGAQDQLQPLRPAGRHRPRAERQPAAVGSQTCTWTDPNGDGIAQLSEISRCGGFPGADEPLRERATGPTWPYSDEVTAGVEREIDQEHARRRDVLLPHQPQSDRRPEHRRAAERVHAGHRQRAERTGDVPPEPTTATVYMLPPAFLGLQNNVVDNEPYLDTKYKGVEFTANKRLSHHWQMVAGFTIGKNDGRSREQHQRDQRPVGHGRPQRSEQHRSTRTASSATTRRPRSGCRAAIRLPCAILIAGSLISNTGFPIASTLLGPAGDRADRRRRARPRRCSSASAATSGCRR